MAEKISFELVSPEQLLATFLEQVVPCLDSEDSLIRLLSP